MSRFGAEQKVWYVPDHADGPGHRDAEAGVVVGVGPPVQPHHDRAYWVRYDDGSGVAKKTYERHLRNQESTD